MPGHVDSKTQPNTLCQHLFCYLGRHKRARITTAVMGDTGSGCVGVTQTLFLGILIFLDSIHRQGYCRRDIFDYDSHSNGAFDYARIAMEIIEMESENLRVHVATAREKNIVHNGRKVRKKSENC